MDKKYFMIVTSEDERYGTNGYGLSYWSDNPWDGLFVGAAYGNTYKELLEQGDYEGLFYQLYSNVTGKRLGYGIVDNDSIRWDIEDYEKE